MDEIVNHLLVGYSPRSNPTQAMAFKGLDRDQCPAEAPAANVVEIQIYVTKLGNIDQKAGTYNLEGYLRLWW